MTETPPEDIIPLLEEVEEDPTRDADGVTEDRLTGVCFYDTLMGAYVGGVHPSKAAARRVEDFKGPRYVLRRV